MSRRPPAAVLATQPPPTLDARTELDTMNSERLVRRERVLGGLGPKYISPGELLKRIRSSGDTSTPQQLHAMINTLLREGSITARRGEFRRSRLAKAEVTYEPQ